MDSKFRKFLELNRTLTDAKQDFLKIMEYLNSVAKKRILEKPYISEKDELEIQMMDSVISDEKIDSLFDHIGLSLQDQFDESFTEKELETLVEYYSNPVMSKWLDFYKTSRPVIEKASSEWFEKTMGDFNA